MRLPKVRRYLATGQQRLKSIPSSVCDIISILHLLVEPELFLSSGCCEHNRANIFSSSCFGFFLVYTQEGHCRAPHNSMFKFWRGTEVFSTRHAHPPMCVRLQAPHVCTDRRLFSRYHAVLLGVRWRLRSAFAPCHLLTDDVQSLLTCSLAISSSSVSGEMTVQRPMVLVCFLFFSCRDYVCIPDINPIRERVCKYFLPL